MQEQSFVLDQDRYIVLTYGEPLEAPLQETAEDFIHKTIRYWQSWVKAATSRTFIRKISFVRHLFLSCTNMRTPAASLLLAQPVFPNFTTAPQLGLSLSAGSAMPTIPCVHSTRSGILKSSKNISISFRISFTNAGDTLQPLYSITGEKDLDEIELDLAGYMNNRPVRIGNKATNKFKMMCMARYLLGLLPLYIDHRLTFAKKSSYKRIVPWLLKQIERTRNMKTQGFGNSEIQTNSYLYVTVSLGRRKAANKIASDFHDDVLMQQAERLAMKQPQ